MRGHCAHDACQRKELDRKQDQCSDKEFSRQSRLPTDAVSLKQTHSGESCHRRSVRDKGLSSDSALVEYEMIHSCEKPGQVSSSRGAFSVGSAISQHERPDCEEKPRCWEKLQRSIHT